jgi:hypothetical protein
MLMHIVGPCLYEIPSEFMNQQAWWCAVLAHWSCKVYVALHAAAFSHTVACSISITMNQLGTMLKGRQEDETRVTMMM